MSHPAISPGRTAVITGGGSGIGLATAARLAERGLNLVIADVRVEALAAGAARLRPLTEAAGAALETFPADVSDPDAVDALRDFAFDRFGDVAILMNNAAVSPGGGAFDSPDRWRRLLSINLMGVVNGVQAFTQAMIDQARPAAIINTGSKQGITNPPGNAAYNAAKAGVKALTEHLAFQLSSIQGGRVSAHLLIPGYTHTGIGGRQSPEKPAAAWTADQVADSLLEGLARGDFYILCPDNEVDRTTDEKRILWAAEDIIRNRPALSRWRPEFRSEFEAFMKR